MKLRNKKTGEIDDFLFEVITDRIDLYRRVGSSDTKNIWKYNSLAELNEEWEDCKPAEPLINLKIDNNQKLLIEEAVVMFTSQDKLRGGYHIKQAQEILNMLNNAELCGEGEE